MKAIIMPSKASGTIMAPPSKSMAHRMLMGAGLAEGTSIIRNIDMSEDIKATLGILESLGCKYHIANSTVTMEGIGTRKIVTDDILDAKESGSTLRFFIPLLLTGGGKYRLEGAKSLFARPLGVYEDICKGQNISFQKGDNFLELEGQLQATTYRIPGNISSQFITGLLYALPILKENSILEVIPPIESRAYIDMTLEALQMYGIRIETEENSYYIKGNQMYHALTGAVEGDYSNAAFLDAFNLIGGDVTVEGLRKDSLQGDQIYQEYFIKLQEDKPEMDISECPDLGPILIGMAAVLNGAVFTGTHRLKIKESDRGQVMAEELSKFGICTEVFDNKIVVHKGKLQKPNQILSSHNDHRIAMTLATLCTITGGVIDNCYAVNKSFPDYYEKISTLGICVEIKE